MEVIQPKNYTPDMDNLPSNNEPSKMGKIVGGLLVVIAGLLFLAREINIPIPQWVFTWQMLVISIGVFTGFKHGFKSAFWVILIFIGVVFLIRDYVPGFQYGNLVWPLALIAFGLYIVFKPRRNNCGNEYRRQRFERFKNKMPEGQLSGDDFLDINSVFGGVERVIVSKNFRGGEINTVFGGAEINLSQAELTDRAQLEINAVFGGVRLVLPPHWVLQSELTAFMGSVEDKRPVSREAGGPNEKILILKGHAVFGGIEVQSY
jgi:predicted membrane protein